MLFFLTFYSSKNLEKNNTRIHQNIKAAQFSISWAPGPVFIKPLRITLKNTAKNWRMDQSLNRFP